MNSFFVECLENIRKAEKRIEQNDVKNIETADAISIENIVQEENTATEPEFSNVVRLVELIQKPINDIVEDIINKISKMSPEQFDTIARQLFPESFQ